MAFSLSLRSYGQMPVHLHQLPPSSRAVLSLETQINENRRTIRKILCIDPFEHKVSIMFVFKYFLLEAKQSCLIISWTKMTYK